MRLWVGAFVCLSGWVVYKLRLSHIGIYFLLNYVGSFVEQILSWHYWQSGYGVCCGVKDIRVLMVLLMFSIGFLAMIGVTSIQLIGVHLCI